LPDKYKEWADKFKLLVFYDWGWLGENEPIYEYPKNYLHSTGAGATIYLTDGLSAQFGFGVPLGPRVLGDEQSIRMYFTLNTEMDRLFLKPKNRLARRP
jgi:hemolysin activation/secretion protein